MSESTGNYPVKNNEVMVLLPQSQEVKEATKGIICCKVGHGRSSAIDRWTTVQWLVETMGPFENSFNPKKPGAKTAKTAGQPPLFNVPLDNPYVGSYKSMTRTNRLDYKSSNRLKTIPCVKIRIPASIYFPISLPLSKNINYMFSSFLYHFIHCFLFFSFLFSF
jgi:hypothetical protein